MKFIATLMVLNDKGIIVEKKSVMVDEETFEAMAGCIDTTDENLLSDNTVHFQPSSDMDDN